jgi:hypothetical protein
MVRSKIKGVAKSESYEYENESGQPDDPLVCDWGISQTHLADVEDGQRVPPAHQQLRIIFIHRPLVVPDGRCILDDDQMIRMFALLLTLLCGRVEQVVRGDHIIDDGRFGDLFGSELTLRGEVFPIVVPQVVVGCDAQRFDPGVDEEFGDDGFELCLSGCERVSA